MSYSLDPNLDQAWHLTFCQAWSWSKLFDTLIWFQKELFEKTYFEKEISRQQDKFDEFISPDEGLFERNM